LGRPASIFRDINGGYDPAGRHQSQSAGFVPMSINHAKFGSLDRVHFSIGNRLLLTLFALDHQNALLKFALFSPRQGPR
jgi:hypothetical protein